MKTPVIPFMKYSTWRMLNGHINELKENIHSDYLLAANLLGKQKFVPGNPPKLLKMDKDSQKALDILWKNYKYWIQFYNEMQEQLQYAYDKCS